MYSSGLEIPPSSLYCIISVLFLHRLNHLAGKILFNIWHGAHGRASIHHTARFPELKCIVLMPPVSIFSSLNAIVDRLFSLN